MQPSAIVPLALALAALCVPAGVIAAPDPAPTLILAGRGGGAASPAEAAAEAQRQTGGKVLAVRQTAGGYEVKVLTPSGQVRLVFIPGAGA
jgi:hypothetical protein